MRAAFYTLGCKVNQYESFALMEQFAGDGFEIVQPGQPADVVVINSCTVTAAGDRKSRQALRRFRRQDPEAVLVLCGCFPQAFPDEAAAIPEADIVTGSKNRGRLLAAVREKLSGGRTERLVSIDAHAADEPFEPLRPGAVHSRTRAFVKIEDGCERRCAYCIIPAARGPVRSKPLSDLRGELEQLAAASYREVVLVGINLSCYGRELGLHLADAVELACSVEGLARVRLGSLEPELLTKESISRLAAQPKLCGQFHLSLQSGCDETLRRMARHYDTARYREIVADLRAAFPGCAVTTDIMVAFPGESEDEYRCSEAFVREIGFARAHVFVYSPRPGTAAVQLPDRVDSPTAASRAKRMAAAAGRAQQDYLRAQIGASLRVLFESQTADGPWEGYSDNYVPVRAAAEGARRGELGAVRITGVERGVCVGYSCGAQPPYNG